VTNLLDSGPGSLRQAIIDTPAGGTVDFQPGLSGTIALTTGELLIDKDLAITGPGADVITVSSNHASRVFNVAAAIIVELSGLTVAEGTVSGSSGRGGGIFNTGTLTVSNCALTGNAANAIYNAGNLVITNSVFKANAARSVATGFHVASSGGGAIYNAGNLVITDSSLCDNSASASGDLDAYARGGAIDNVAGTLTATACTFSGNSTSSSTSRGGTSRGGAIENFASTLTVTACTFSGNTVRFSGMTSEAGGGAIDNAGTLTVTACTLSGNSATGNTYASGGAIYNRPC
jgi:hypothetical protein